MLYYLFTVVNTVYNLWSVRTSVLDTQIVKMEEGRKDVDEPEFENQGGA